MDKACLWDLHCGDCLAVLPTLAENTLDSCVTDPPYHLTSIVKRFSATGHDDNTITSDRTRRRADGYARLAGGFMGKKWDGGDIAFRVELWREVYRVLKPGAHLLAFGGTRTYHRMACAIEDAGFEVRDCIQWLYGSGFPKSHNVSKGIDKAAGVERAGTGKMVRAGCRAARAGEEFVGGRSIEAEKWKETTAPITDAAKQWDGWGTALKPACELIVLARKPLSEPTVAANVLKWGTGAINIDGCRVEAEIGDYADGGQNDLAGTGWGHKNPARTEQHPNGRWPANVIHDGSEEVIAGFPDTPGQLASVGPEHGARLAVNTFGDYGPRDTFEPRGDDGSAARFFYAAKADNDDRLGSKHPTVKPVDLIQYLVRLVTPPRGLVLDPFAGTGTTGEACIRERVRAILIEREPEYQDDIRRRMKLALSGLGERTRETIKAKLDGKPVDAGPLFENR